ncbi:hypothetical protein TNCV_2802901 [Trichonephila clavipes]|nr:hypothetical protein TNCV_2802901 [Trichonephila clavipes]
MYGRANGNSKDALRMYYTQFPKRRIPDHRIFQRLHRPLRKQSGDVLNATSRDHTWTNESETDVLLCPTSDALLRLPAESCTITSHDINMKTEFRGSVGCGVLSQ